MLTNLKLLNALSIFMLTTLSYLQLKQRPALNALIYDVNIKESSDVTDLNETSCINLVSKTQTVDSLEESPAKYVQIEQNYDVCPICLESFDIKIDPFMTRCGHWFHQNCFKRLAPVTLRSDGNNYECPLCRKMLTIDKNTEIDKLIRLFLARGKDESVEKDKLIKVLQYLVSIKFEPEYIKIIITSLMTKTNWDVNERIDEEGNTMVIYSARVRNPVAIMNFISKGADVNIEDYSGHGALYYAIENDDEVTAKQLIENPDILLLCGNQDVSLLNLAIKNRMRHVAKALIDRGANVNEKDEESGLNAVQQMIIVGDYFNYHLSELIRKDQVELDFKDGNGQNLLHWAVKAKNCEALNFILRGVKTGKTRNLPMGISVDSLDKFDQSPLLLACKDKNPNVEIVRLLINAGAKADLRTGTQRSPIEYVILNTYDKGALLKTLLVGEPEIDPRFFVCERESYAAILKDYAVKKMKRSKKDGNTRRNIFTWY